MTLQDLHANGLASVPSIPIIPIANGVLVIVFIYCLTQILKSDPFLPRAGLLWNFLVYLTPESLISHLYPAYNTLPPKDNGKEGAGSSSSKKRPKKSDAMWKIFGFDNTRILAAFQRPRSLPPPIEMAVIASKAPPGLGNWDNSCYQNSILQGLASLRSLPGYLDQGISNGEESSTGVTMKHLVNRLNSPSNAGKMFWTPPQLKNMSSWQQQDAQEYFSKVLDEIDKDVSQSAAARSKNSGLKALVDLEPEREADDPQPGTGNLISKQRLLGLPDELNDLMARNPLEGLLAQRVGCLRCRYVAGLSLIPFNCLTVSLGCHWMYDVRTCLDEYTTLEPINGVECAKCTLLRAKRQYETLLEQLKSMASASTIPGALNDSLAERLTIVNATLDDEDFSDTALKKCEISANNRVSTTKSRQAVIARVPESLVIHINRSVFDEITGAQRKNLANVRFPEVFDLSPWCLGSDVLPDLENNKTLVEEWIDDPAKSMLSAEIQDVASEFQILYQLRAVVTHSGRHENGHYVCYRKYASPTTTFDGENEKPVEKWWRLSDETVSEASKDEVLSQGGVFMLFYERIAHPPLPKRVVTEDNIPADAPQPVESTESSRGEAANESEDLAPLLVPAADSAEAAHSGEPISNDPTDLSTSENQTSATTGPDDHVSETSSSTSDSSSPPAMSPKMEDAPKENRQVTHTMRTAPPRRGSKGMGQVSSMISAN